MFTIIMLTTNDHSYRKISNLRVRSLVLRKLKKARLRVWQFLKDYSDHMYDLFAFRKQFRRIFQGKTVAIVGGGPSILAKKYGKSIDSNDIVVHINLIDRNKREEHFGSRTDVRYLGANFKKFDSCEIKILIGKEIAISTAKNKDKRGVPQTTIFHSRSVPVRLTKKFIKDYSFEFFGRSQIRPPRSGVIFVLLLLFWGYSSKISLYGFSVDPSDGMIRIGNKSNAITHYDKINLEKNHCTVELEAAVLKHLHRRNAIKIY